MGLENPLHIAILLVLVLLVFGARRLPEIGRSLGEGMRGFKDSLTGTTEPVRDALTPTPAPPAAAAPPPPVPAATAPPAPAAAPVEQPAPTPDSH